MKRIIFLELNEVPEKIFRESFKNCNYKKKLSDFTFNPTLSEDQGHLSPWVTWATVHRGITNKIHKITDINQNVCHLDKKYPTIMKVLAREGHKVGVFGSMHSASVAINEYKEYSFFVPEAFAIDPKCKPKSINSLQNLNLIMSKASARVVNKKLPNLKILTKAIYSYYKHHFQFNGAIETIKQLILEIFKPWTKVRRRTLQSIILFDIYMDLLTKEKPTFSTFFTNHVASNMHRFWEAKFPEEYSSKISSNKWKKRYEKEIDIAMEATAYFINKLTWFVDRNEGTELWIISSMGQAAVPDYKPGNEFWKIYDIKTFISSICQKQLSLNELTQMIPCYSIESDEETIKFINKKLNEISTNASLIIRSVTKTTLAFYLEAYDLKTIFFKNNLGQKIKFKGIKRVVIDEKSGSSAYHVPSGILYRYGSNIKKIDENFLDKNENLLTHKIKDLIKSSLTI